MVSEALLEAAQAWLAADPDPATREELSELITRRDVKELAARFEGPLAFGTAGIRAQLGAGPLRLNRLVIARVAIGLARMLGERSGGARIAGVVIGYDGRTNSEVFATDAARILARSGSRVWILPRPLPTPVLAFAVRYFGADIGVMVTASHNPRDENGVKVYSSDGAQFLPPDTELLGRLVDAVDPLQLPHGWEAGSFDHLAADDVVEAYLDTISVGWYPPAIDSIPAHLVAVHTALHGVSAEVLRSACVRSGWAAPVSVTAQEMPDPSFPTTPFPNPEEPGTLDMARATAMQVHADLVLANDPDGDRLAVMVPGPSGWKALSGDETGALLGKAVIDRLVEGRSIEALGRGVPVVATTVASASLLRRLACAAGIRCVTTLTGFKWIIRAAGPEGYLVYGYEEALGYAVHPRAVADKDGISAALLVMGLALTAKQSGRTLGDLVDDIYLVHGVHVTRQRSLHAKDPGEWSRLARALESIRQSPPAFQTGESVAVTDLRSGNGGLVDLAGGIAERWPGRLHGPADVLVWHVGDSARVVFRPSGTEAKLKVYVETMEAVENRAVLDDSRRRATARAEAILDWAVARLAPHKRPSG